MCVHTSYVNNGFQFSVLNQTILEPTKVNTFLMLELKLEPENLDAWSLDEA